MAIRALPPEVVAQIAAGEVVERPASVVKELVENSIDAGARNIRIEVEGGGRRLVRVSDDGCGIRAGEVEAALRRHSTSKLSSAEDLNHITSLGFRGEALAAIAAVSRVTLVSRAADEQAGSLVRVEGGQVTARRSAGRGMGTTVTVEDLFYNVPARRKFLRSEVTERRHIDAWVTRYALAYPGVGFALIHDGRETFRSSGNGSLRDVLMAVHGLEVGAALLEIPEDPGRDPAMTVAGFVSPPGLHRADRGGITLFVNGRWIQDARLAYAVVQAYHTLLPAGRYPLAVVILSLPPEEVDVNVHPTKAEVRFRDSDAVFRALQRAVRQTVLDKSPVAPAVLPAYPVWPAWQFREAYRLPRAPLTEEEAPSEQAPLLPQPAGGMPILRAVGQVGATYIVAEGPDGLYLIDQHAAHERVLYEQIMAQRVQGVPAQGLLRPAVVQLPAEQAGLVEAHVDTLQRLGFDIEPFGGSAFLVRALPAVLSAAQPSQVLADIAEGLEEGRCAAADEMERMIVRQVCKQAAVKAGQILTHEEMQELVRALEACQSPRTCPHGRPTMIHISVSQLAQQFGRS